MFTYMHSAQEEGWWPEGDVIAVYTNPLLTQREQESIISPTERMRAISTVQCEEVEDLIASIRNKDH